MMNNFEIILSELKEASNDCYILLEILDGLDEKINTPALIKKLILLQAIRFNVSSLLSWLHKMSPIPTILPRKNLEGFELILEDDYKPNDIEISYDKALFTLLSDLQNILSSLITTRLYRQYQLSVEYDFDLINTSPVFQKYTENTKQKTYSNGSLALDLDRGVLFKINQAASIDMNDFLSQKQNKIEVCKQLMINTADSIQNINTRISHLTHTAGDEITHEKLIEIKNEVDNLIEYKTTLEKEYDQCQERRQQLQAFIDNRFNCILHFVKDEAKADVLNRFGHQLIVAELIEEMRRIFKNIDNTDFIPWHPVDSEALHQISFEDDHIYIDVHVAFDCASNSNGVFCAFAMNKKNLVWSKDANIAKEKRGIFLEAKARIELIENPENKGEYCLQVIAFQAISHTPDLIPRSEYIPAEYIEIKENERSPYATFIDEACRAHINSKCSLT